MTVACNTYCLYSYVSSHKTYLRMSILKHNFLQTRTMHRIRIFMLHLLRWIILQHLSVASANSACEVECLCDASPGCWNQLSCCQESLLHQKVRSSRDASLFTPAVRYPPSLGGNRKKRGIGMQHFQKSSCVYPAVHAEQFLEEFNDIIHKYSFRVIHGCSENHVGSDLHAKCLAFRNISSLDSNIPVVSGKTKAIYANKFCGHCNNIDNFEPFTHQFVCGNALYGDWELLSLEKTPENQMGLIRSGLCIYALQPPDTVTLEIPENRCLAAKHTSCSSTIGADIVDKRVWNNCHSSVASQDESYCAFCGDTEFSYVGGSVNNSVQASCNEGCPKYIDTVMSFSFFILLNIDEALSESSDDRAMKPRDLKCGNATNDVYDNFMVSILINPYLTNGFSLTFG